MYNRSGIPTWPNNPDIATTEMLLAATRNGGVTGADNNINFNNYAMLGTQPAAAASHLLYGASRDALLRRHQAFQQQQQTQLVQNVLAKPPPKPKRKEVIQIDDSSDEETGNDNRKRPPTATNSESAKRLKTNEMQRQDNLPALSRKTVIDTLKKSENEKIQKALQTVLYHSTGYTASTAPSTMAFPPDKVTISLTKIHDFVKEIVDRQIDELKIVVETTIQHCTQVMEERNEEKDQIKAVETKQEQQPNAAVLQRQQLTIDNLKREIAELKKEKKTMADSYNEEKSKLDSSHTRAIRAYMKASVKSFRYLRDLAMVSSEDEDAED